MAVLRHEINLFVTNYTATGDTNEKVLIITTNYSGTVTWYLEIYGYVPSGTCTIYLRDSVYNVYATISLTETSPTLKRVQLSTAPVSDRYYITLSGTAPSGLWCGRLIGIQNTDSLTASESQFELGNYTTTTSNSYIAPPEVKYFTYTGGNWDGTITAYFEAVLRSSASSSIAYAELQVDDGSWANWAEVASSPVSVTGTILKLVQSSAISLTDGRHYRIAIKSSATNRTCVIYNAKLVIVQTGTITKTEDHYLLTPTTYDATGLQDYPTIYKTAEWSGATNTFYYSHCSNHANNATKLVDVTADPDTDLTNATCTGINQQISSAITMPTNDHIIDTNITTLQSGYHIFTTCIIALSTITAGTVNYKTLTANASVLSSRVVTTGKVLTSSVLGTGSAIRGIAKVLAGNVTIGATCLRKTGKALLSSAIITATTISASMFNKVLTATITAASGMVKSSSKILTGAITATSTMVRGISKALTSTITITASRISSIAKALLASISITANVDYTNMFYKTLISTVTAAASMARGISKILAGTMAITATITRKMAKAMLASITITASKTASIAKTLLASTVIAATAVYKNMFYKVLIATVTATSAMVKGISKALTASNSIASTMVRAIGKALTATVTASGILAKAITKILTASISIVSTVTRGIGKGLTASANITGEVVRSISKALSTAISVTSSFVATLIAGGVTIYYKTLTTAINATASITKKTKKILNGLISIVCDINIPIRRIKTIVLQVAERLLSLIVKERTTTLSSTERTTDLSAAERTTTLASTERTTELEVDD